MIHRLLQITLPSQQEIDEWHAMLPEIPATAQWELRAGEGRAVVTLLIPAEETEGIFDQLSERFDPIEGFSAVLLPVEATLPRPREEKTEDKPGAEQDALDGDPPPSPSGTRLRISRDELYEDVLQSARFDLVYVIMVFLSSIVAGIGLLRSDVAVIIGAMVIVPLLGPNVALALATALGDRKLAARAVKANLVGMGTALAIGIAMGLLLTVNPGEPEIASRTHVTLGDILLGLAAGVAGAIAFTTGVSMALVGVMVAVALLPPLMTFGMLVGHGNWHLAVGAAMLLAVNVICVNLAAVATFLAQGIGPNLEGEREQVRLRAMGITGLWALLLAVLAVLIVLSQRMWG